MADDGQRVSCGQAHRSVALATRETRTLDEPGRGELDATVGLRPARHRHAAPDLFLDRTKLVARDDRVDEERSTAPPIDVTRLQHHRLRSADIEDAPANVGERR